ncbi:MAG: hypothetical protein COA74_02325 [Gammaproteobacteria bacterium]|nr:MAG: hypothetical protein COA74_02325 [Gammaproteobacteria bacterium]
MRPYVNHYDLLYSDKPYENDIKVFNELNAIPNNGTTLLEFGAGTGRHSELLLEQCKYLDIVEIDDDFIEKLSSRLNGITHFNIGRTVSDLGSPLKYDAACAFFNVINYIETKDELQIIFKNIAHYLKPKSRFLFDIWNGDAMLHSPPKEETRVKQAENWKATIKIVPDLNIITRYMTMKYQVELQFTDKDNENYNEELNLKAWLPTEIKTMLITSGFNRVDIVPTRDINSAIREDDWTLWFLATKL